MTTSPLPNLVARTTVSAEYAALMGHGHCPTGTYVLPTADNMFVWDVVLFVHQGFYADATLKLRLTFPENYPDSAPSVRFLTEVFHPLISQDGHFALDWRFRTWRPKEQRVFDVLYCIKSAFKQDTLEKLREEDCINREAFRCVFRFPGSSTPEGLSSFRHPTFSLASRAVCTGNLSSPSLLSPPNPFTYPSPNQLSSTGITPSGPGVYPIPSNFRNSTRSSCDKPERRLASQAPPVHPNDCGF